jgi:DNA repair exonuclease SbcCD ATPase subunit
MAKDNTRDQLDEARTKIQKLEDTVDSLEKSDSENAKQHLVMAQASSDQHQETMGEIRKLNDKLEPIADSYRTATTLGKWLIALLSFIAILLSVVTGWIKIFNK